ncbi:MAG: hypothetical protein MJ096_06125 [Clostridia bacterium]|nr:hypothetical protein [Clostridia bacterium]
MTEKQLMEALTSAVSEDHVSKTLEGMKKASTRRKARGAALAAAACLCLVVGTFFTVSHFTRESAPESDFVIEDGVLLAYNGNDTDVVVPEEVHTITRTSFTSGSTDIRTISLGRNVSEIDKAAFVNLSSLEKIKVDSENETYVSDGGFLGKRDGTVYFGFIHTGEEAHALFDFISEVQTGGEANRDMKEIIIGNGTLAISVEANPREGDDPAFIVTVTSVSAYGRTKVFDEPRTLVGNFLTYIYQTDEAFVMAQTNSEGLGAINIFAESGEYEIMSYEKTAGLPEEERKDVLLTGICDRDDGKLGYIKIPQKYTNHQYYYSELTYVVSRSEFAKEEGYIDLSGGEMVFVPTKTYTVSELFDLDADFAAVLEYVADHPDDIYVTKNGVRLFNNIPVTDTLDELFAYNAERYGEYSHTRP